VTSAAILPEFAIVDILVDMTLDTEFGGIGEVPIGMTPLTGCALMGAGEWESGLIMVECRWDPCACAVTLGASFPQGASMGIHIAVTIDTLAGGPVVLTVLVAGLASDLSMCSG
jgi:hypothetical protein